MDGSLPDWCEVLPRGDTALSRPLLPMAPRRIHYSETQNFNAVMKAAEVRAPPLMKIHRRSDSPVWIISTFPPKKKSIKCHLAEPQLSEWATMAFKRPHSLPFSPEKRRRSKKKKKKKRVKAATLMFHEKSSFISKLPRSSAPSTIVARLITTLWQMRKIHICIRDAFMPVYSVFEGFTAPHFKTTLLHWLTPWCQPAEGYKAYKVGARIGGLAGRKEGGRFGWKKRENSIKMWLCCALQKREKKPKAMGKPFGGREWNIIAWGVALLKSLEGIEAQNSSKLGPSS